MEKSSAFFTETPLPDLIRLAVVDHLFADAVGRIRIAAVHRKKCGQCVVSVDDHFHLRRAFHDFFQNIHGDVDLSVPVQLIPEQIGQHHIIWFEMREYPAGRRFINLDTGIVCLQVPGKSCRKGKSCRHTI